MGWKNSGKTGLVERLVADITARGFTVSTIKHAHHDVDLDQPGKDTWRHRQAGAQEVVMASAHRYAILHETRGAEPGLGDLLARLAPVDLVLVEGYKRDSHPKIEVLRAATGQPLIQPGDPTVSAVASDAGLAGLGVPHFDLDDTAAIADFVLAQCGLPARFSTRFPAGLPAGLRQANRAGGPGGDPAHSQPGPDFGGFDTVIVVDWSGRASLSPAKPSADAIWIGITRSAGTEVAYHRSRAGAEAALAGLFAAERQAGRRVLAGFDFPLGYPAGFAMAASGQPDPLILWDWIAARVTDDAHNGNNRFAVAAAINRALGPDRPFWGRPATLSLPDLPPTKAVRYGTRFGERRLVEQAVPRAQPVWKLYTTGSVGSQALLGLPVLARLRRVAGAQVWPFQPATGPLVFAEIYPGLIDRAVKADPDPIKDRAQVRLLSRALWQLARAGALGPLFALPDSPAIAQEGWILGAGHAGLLEQVLAWP